MHHGHKTHPSSSDFHAAKRSSDRGIAGLVNVNKVVNVRTYELEKVTIGPDGTRGPRQAGGLFTGSRAMLLSGLTPGTIYAVHVRTVGGSTNYSDWSESVTRTCI